ncbi:MAG TPA: gephyrin-like molybdotransferase Glp [Terriglobia bacterium]|nr:gephyrin-like molybdotransferase Glp [Terriglobia bacterium]
MVVTYEQALVIVQERISGANPRPLIDTVPLDQVRGRVLAEDVMADRDLPPFHRAVRDGYALRAADLSVLPAVLRCVGEVPAGRSFEAVVGSGQCVSIMTGAPLPAGTDAVVMVEHTRSVGDCVEIQRSVRQWENVVLQGSEAAMGARILPRGSWLQAAEIGLLAAVGKATVAVYRQPRVAILPTGDEVVPVEQPPQWFQIRNSNAVTLAAQVSAAGGAPTQLGIAPDRRDVLRKMIEQGLKSDLLLLSGGVSMGKFDLVEEVLAELGAEFFFQGVAIRPGKPLVFGRVGELFFFGLPGNPVSTFVTFELFVRPALALLGGAGFEPPVFLRARLASPCRQKAGLTMFMPARVWIQNRDPVVELVGWQGSGDLVGIAAANCFLVIHPDQTELAAGDWVDVMPKGQGLGSRD